jgi:16S rRNA (cytosine967-C5)-methyltransferase
MHYLWQHAKTIVATYTGNPPLAVFLKHYFSGYKKLGSRDRRLLSDIAYSWYRVSKGLPEGLPFEEAVLLCLALCGRDKSLGLLSPGFTGDTAVFNIELIFPEVPLTSPLTRNKWLAGMLVQPDLFLRLRGNIEASKNTFQTSGIPFTPHSDACIALPNGTSVEKILPPNAYVVQDYASQQTARWWHPAPGEQWLDCCCGAGGKALLLTDLQPGVRLTATDVRATVLHNLAGRFKQYHLPQPETHVVDFSKGVPQKLAGRQFSHIIADVPCTGSGTWARTPEQLYFFKPDQVDNYARLQRQIATNTWQLLAPGGSLYYITCSVFAAENEHNLAQLATVAGAVVEELTLIDGTDLKGDCMFVGVVQKT